MANVRFVRTTKQKYVNKDIYDEDALYFLTDTAEFARAGQILSDGARIVPTYADLPGFDFVADGVIYFTMDTNNAYIMNPERNGWIQVIYAPAKSVDEVPEEMADEVVATVAAVLSVEEELKAYVAETAVTVGGCLDCGDLDSLEVV